MSDVKMCDRCGKIFSVNAADWTTFTGTRVTREDGKMKHTTVQNDWCPMCSGGPEVVEPRLSIGASAGAERIADTLTQEDRDRILGSDSTAA